MLKIVASIFILGVAGLLITVGLLLIPAENSTPVIAASTVPIETPVKTNPKPRTSDERQYFNMVIAPIPEKTPDSPRIQMQSAPYASNGRTCYQSEYNTERCI